MIKIAEVINGDRLVEMLEPFGFARASTGSGYDDMLPPTFYDEFTGSINQLLGTDNEEAHRRLEAGEDAAKTLVDIAVSYEASRRRPKKGCQYDEAIVRHSVRVETPFDSRVIAVEPRQSVDLQAKRLQRIGLDGNEIELSTILIGTYDLKLAGIPRGMTVTVGPESSVLAQGGTDEHARAITSKLTVQPYFKQALGVVIDFTRELQELE